MSLLNRFDKGPDMLWCWILLTVPEKDSADGRINRPSSDVTVSSRLERCTAMFEPASADSLIAIEGILARIWVVSSLLNPQKA